MRSYEQQAHIDWRLQGSVLDLSFAQWDINAAYRHLRDNKSEQGARHKAFWSGKDFPGCTLGLGGQSLSANVAQFGKDSNCSGWSDTDYKRTLLAVHETGHNQDANHAPTCPGCPWRVVEPLHTHRSIMYHVVNEGHYHDCFSQINLGRIVAREGTQAVGPTCN